ncbi:MOSC domain-containing protein [Cellulophaga baltica]|uniref:MOSC domain-containing protein n=1 Tax=Cellulophaga baltica TaxID=76594 RepID=UPI0024941D3A|nr:MOSC N-terminal beta barrel domain-containing protein [Cellulophaga baltica]
MKIDSLHIYPLKSAKGIAVQTTEVENIGFKYDRYFAILNSEKEVLTAREFPTLLKIKTQFKEDNLVLEYGGKRSSIDLNDFLNPIEVAIFKEPASGKEAPVSVNNWLSSILEIDCSLIKINTDNLRQTGHNAISFCDLHPIHLITQESVNALNKKLATAIEIDRFRANIVISGLKPFEENTIAKITIGQCEFVSVLKTERCTLITIDPKTGEKDKKQEPLRTLAKEFRTDKKVEMGIYLIPTKLGTIHATDPITVEMKMKE